MSNEERKETPQCDIDLQALMSPDELADLLRCGTGEVHKIIRDGENAFTCKQLPVSECKYSSEQTLTSIRQNASQRELQRRTIEPQRSSGEKHLLNGAFIRGNILPRLVRLRDASGYLGMDPNRFNAEVRPQLIEIPIGKQGIAFDRLDLDEWADEYKGRNGRPGKQRGGEKPWDARKYQASLTGKGSGISTRLSEKEEFAKALERATSKKRKSI